MKKGGIGGANTQTGIKFEGQVDLLTALEKLKGYDVKGNTIFYNGDKVAYSYRKNSLYTFLKEQG